MRDQRTRSELLILLSFLYVTKSIAPSSGRLRCFLLGDSDTNMQLREVFGLVVPMADVMIFAIVHVVEVLLCHWLGVHDVLLNRKQPRGTQLLAAKHMTEEKFERFINFISLGSQNTPKKYGLLWSVE